MRIATGLFSVFCLLGALPAHAVTAEKESTYEIEILVFENRLPELLGDELLSSNAEAPAIAPDETEAPEAAVSEPYLLPTMANLLEKDGHYRILAHQFWQQTIDAKTVAKPVRVIAANPAELDGTIRFFMSRHLHLNANLRFHDLTSGSVITEYRLNEQRKLKSQEIHYFDHPKFGMLVRVMPLLSEKDKVKPKP